MYFGKSFKYEIWLAVQRVFPVDNKFGRICDVIEFTSLMEMATFHASDSPLKLS